MTKSIPPELGARMLAQGIAHEIERCSGKLPIRRGMRPILTATFGWSLVILASAGAVKFFLQ